MNANIDIKPQGITRIEIGNKYIEIEPSNDSRFHTTFIHSNINEDKLNIIFGDIKKSKINRNYVTYNIRRITINDDSIIVFITTASGHYTYRLTPIKKSSNNNEKN